MISLFLCLLPLLADPVPDRLDPVRLLAVQRGMAELAALREDVPRVGGVREVRANLHVHSRRSHDSRGTVEEIVAAAKRVGTEVVMFTEHPVPQEDFFLHGHSGVRDGVLLIPGAELRGFLCFPAGSVQGLDGGGPQEFADLVRGRDGLLFVSHLEERMDWRIRGVTGVEIYNTHADFKDETALLKKLRNPLWLLQSSEVFRSFPQEAFSALHDYPADYLRKWDELCATAPHTGVAANDAHQNVGLILKVAAPGRVALFDALEKPLLELPAAGNPALEPLLAGKEPGDVVFDLRLDRYEHSLRHVATHLLLSPGQKTTGQKTTGQKASGLEVSRESVWEALEAGRAFVAFDWLADSTGFDCAVLAENTRSEMGSQVRLTNGCRLQAEAPLPVEWRVIRDGKELARVSGRRCDQPIEQTGVYRVEAWLELAGEHHIWILSNPFYVGP